jgi:hypothetical protein
MSIRPTPSPLDDGDRVFTITLDDSSKLKRKWPPSPVPLLAFSVPLLLLYPMWVVIFAKYRDESKHVPESPILLSIVLDAVAMLVLDQIPKVAANILVLHVAACLSFLGLWQLGIIHRR